MSERRTVTLAHLSDVHLPPVSGFAPRYWNIKRVLGWLNWQRKRRFVHTRAALDAVTADLIAQAPDHILVSGDLVNIGLPAEYIAATAWLATLGPAGRVSVVPGNHDIYVEPEATAGVAGWSAYMTSDAASEGIAVAADQRSGLPFPYVRRVGPVAIIGVNSAVPTLPGSAAGEVGTAQLARLADVLARCRDGGLVRVVMIHHPPVPGLATGKRALRDCAALARVLEANGAELVVHGHNHTLTSVIYAEAAIEGTGSASAGRALGHEPLACYNLYRITRDQHETQIAIQTRGLVMAGGHVQEVAATRLVRHSRTTEHKIKGTAP